jgi:hypothetical protein
MAYSSIAKPTDYFNTVLYTGNGSTNAITGVGFQPDWLWVKCRSNANGGQIFDALRTTNSLSTNESAAEADRSGDGFTSLDSDGFTMNGSGSGGNTNASSRTYVAWNWLAGNSTSSNSNGDLTSTVSVNTTAGFSICQWTSSDTGSVRTVGHGLGVKPDWILWKSTSRTVDWINFHVSTGKDKNAGWLNQTSASSNQNYWGNTEPTSTVFSTEGATEDSGTNIAYCFAEKKGYSKFGSYTGNGNTDGTFIYTGFSPAWIMGKRTDSANNWYMFDSTRNTFNVTDKKLRADSSAAENVDSSKTIDIVSNGFKIKSSDAEFNASSGSYIYMAFAENPFVGNDSGTAVPVTAR